MKTQYILRAFSDPSGDMDPAAVRELLDLSDRLGAEHAPLTVIKPEHNPNEDKRWGLEIEIHGD